MRRIFGGLRLEISDSLSDVVVPSLVAKISRVDRVAWMGREAWFFEEPDSECLQGSIIPYCYGWFEMELRSRCEVPPLGDYPIDQDAAEEMNDMDDTDDEEETEEREADSLTFYESSDTYSVHPMLAERDRRCDIVSVLILERHGGGVRPLWESR